MTPHQRYADSKYVYEKMLDITCIWRSGYQRSLNLNPYKLAHKCLHQPYSITAEICAKKETKGTKWSYLCCLPHQSIATTKTAVSAFPRKVIISWAIWNDLVSSNQVT